MTDTVQPLAVSFAQQGTSENRVLDEANIQKSPVNKDLPSRGFELAYEANQSPKVDEFGKERIESNSFGVHLKPQVASEAVETRTSSIPNQEANSSGRWNPEPFSGPKAHEAEARTTPSTFSACVTSNSATTAVALSREHNEKTGNNGEAKRSMAGGTPVTEAVKVQVIRPYPVKTAPQAAVAPRVAAEVVAPLAVAARPNPAGTQVPVPQRLTPENGAVSSEIKEESRRRMGGVRNTQQEQRTRNEENAAAAKLKEQQYQRKEEVKRRQAAQCNFSARPGTQHHPDGRVVETMAPTEVLMPHVQHGTGSRQHAGGHDQGGQGYPQQPGHGQRQVRTHSNATTISGVSAGGRRQPHSRSISAGSANMDMDGGPTSVPPTPLFERLVSEEVQEIKAYARLVDNQNSRLAELERVHKDLEQRLRLLTNERMQLEATLEERERSWSSKVALLEKDRDKWKNIVKVEESKNEKLLEQLGRKDMDIHRMLARKYDHQRDKHNISHSVRNFKAGPSHSERAGTPPASIANQKASSSSSPAMGQHKSPHEILKDSGTVEAVRERNVANSLLDFFGM